MTTKLQHVQCDKLKVHSNPPFVDLQCLLSSYTN